MTSLEQQQVDAREAFAGLGEALTEAFRPLVETVAKAFTTLWEALGPLARAVMADEVMDPEMRTAVRALSDALDDAEQTHQVALDGLRLDLLGLPALHALRERMWASLTPGLTESDVLAAAHDALDDWHPEVGVRRAVAILEGWSERCAR